MRAHAWWLLGCLTACQQGGGAPTVDVQIVDPTGRNAVEAADGTLTVRLRHRGELVSCEGGPCTSEITSGAFQLALPLETFDGVNEAQIELDTDTAGRLLGATPPFQLYGEGVDITGSLRLIVAPPSTCRSLALRGFVTDETPQLSRARRHAAPVVRRNVALIAGGEDTAGAADDVDRFDMLLFDADPLGTFEGDAIGPAHGFTLSEDRSLVVGDTQWLFREASLELPAAEQLVLHAGAGFRSTLVDLAENGVAVVGGAGSSQVSWISQSGSFDGTSALVTGRDRAAAASLIGGVLVVGGHAEGEPTAEWVPRRSDGRALALALPRAQGGVLFASPDRTDALWIGFAVDGAPSAEALLLTDCDASGCAAIAPRPWSAPRSDFAHVVTEAGTLWLIGGRTDEGAVARVDLVRWDGDDVVIAEGPSLASARSGAAAFEHASGIVTVVGGESAALLADAEMCFPATLDPL